MRRDAGYDVVRVVALWMILLCHLLSHCSFSLAAPLHDIFAQCGNCLFFMLSGCLLGRKWRLNGCGGYGFEFVCHRVFKIWITFAAFVIPYMVLLHICGHSLSPRQIVFNVIGLSEFVSLPAAGHLWFVTAIFFFYLTLVGVSRVGALMRRRAVIAVTCSLLLATGVQFVLKGVNLGIAGLVPFVWGGGMAFVFEDKLHTVGSRRLLLLIASSIPVCAWLLGWGLQTGAPWTVRIWVSFVMAAAAIIITLRGCRGRVVPAWVTSMGAISFEVYLVHCIFLEDVFFSWHAFFGGNILFYSLNYFIASFTFAWLLNRAICTVKGFLPRLRAEI